MNTAWKRICLIYSVVFFFIMLLIALNCFIPFIWIDVNKILLHIVYFTFLAAALAAAYFSDSKIVAILSLIDIIMMLLLIDKFVIYPVSILGYLVTAAIKKAKILKLTRIIISAIYLSFFALLFPVLLFANITVSTVLEESYSPDGKYYVQEIDHDSGALGGSSTVFLYREYLKLGGLRVSGQRRLLASGKWAKRFPVIWIDNETVSVSGREYSVSTPREWNSRINKNETAYTREEMLGLFSANREQFEELAKLIQTDEDFYTKKQATFRDVNLKQNSDSDFFTEEEWGKITIFFFNYQPMDIKCLDENTVVFRFPSAKDKSACNLVYTANGLTETLTKFQGSTDIVEKINDNWWLVIREFRTPSLTRSAYPSVSPTDLCRGCSRAAGFCARVYTGGRSPRLPL